MVCSCSRRARYVGQGVATRAGPGCADRVGTDGEHRQVGGGLLIEVVRLDRVDDPGVGAEDAQQLAADDGVRTLDVVVDGFADVVEHPRLARDRLRHAELGGEDAADVTGLLAVEQRVLTVREAVVQRADQLGQLGPALHLHLPQGLLAELAHAGGQRPAGAQQQRRHVGGLELAVDHLERGLPGHLAADRVHAAERRLGSILVDAEVHAGVVGDHRQRAQQAFAAVLVELLERDRCGSRSAVGVAAQLPFHGLDDQRPCRRGGVADALGDGCLDARLVLGGELVVDALEHGPRRGLAVDGRSPLDGGRRLRPHRGDRRDPLVDLLAPLLVEMAALVEHGAAVAMGPLTFLEEGVAGLDGLVACQDLLTHRLARRKRLMAGLRHQPVGLPSCLGRRGPRVARRPRPGPGSSAAARAGRSPRRRRRGRGRRRRSRRRPPGECTGRVPRRPLSLPAAGRTGRRPRSPGRGRRGVPPAAGCAGDPRPAPWSGRSAGPAAGSPRPGPTEPAAASASG